MNRVKDQTLRITTWRKLLFVCLALVCCGASLRSGDPTFRVADPADFPFANGETLIYEGRYTRFIFRGIMIGELKMTANQFQSGSSSRWKFVADADSKGFLRKLFGVDFHFYIESENEAQPLSTIRVTKSDQQNDVRIESEITFDRGNGSGTWTERNLKKNSIDTKSISYRGELQNVSSIFYSVRTQNLDQGSLFEVPVFDWGEVYRVPCRVVKREKLKTVLGEIQTVRVDASVFGPGRLLTGKGDLSIWMTDDWRRIPVRAQFNYAGGRVEIKLKSMSG